MTEKPHGGIELPPGFSGRPATFDDISGVTALFNACEIRESGRVQTSEEDNRREWLAPSFNLETDTLAVFSSKGQVVAYAEVWDRAPHVVIFTWARVHPDFTGQGLGSALVVWAERRAAQAVEAAPEGARIVVRQGVPGTEREAQTLLEAHGYSRVREFHRMVIEMTEPPPTPRLPDGVRISTFKEFGNLREIVRADQEAFLDHWGVVQRSLDEELIHWEQRINSDPDFDPELWFVALAGEEIAGICLCSPKMTEDPNMGWISALGVLRPWRRRGLGLALLHRAFGVLYRRGTKRVALGVDAESLTGATRLYERAGMRVQRFSYTFEKELRAGEDLSAQPKT
jgi:mycothiol synthase